VNRNPRRHIVVAVVEENECVILRVIHVTLRIKHVHSFSSEIANDEFLQYAPFTVSTSIGPSELQG
jgi:hypothetical protein